MSQPRYSGKLKKWNTERGFGFIVADDGGQDIFVHISAFARDGRQPAEGEVLTFEVEPDRNGKRSAVRVRRPGDVQRNAAPRRPVRLSKSGTGNTGIFGKLISGALVCTLLWVGYSQYASRAAKFDCSQMTSCSEATLYLQNCPGTQMDGNGDGVPCEKQWCKK